MPFVEGGGKLCRLNDYVVVFGRFVEDVSHVRTPGPDLEIVFPGEIYSLAYELLADALPAKTLVDLCVIYNYYVWPYFGIRHFGDPLAVLFDKKCAAAPMFIPLNLHSSITANECSFLQTLPTDVS